MTAEEAQRIALRTAAERFVPLDPTNLVVTRRRIWPFPVYWEVCTETPNGSTRITLRDRDGEWVYFGLRSRRQPLPKRYVLAIVAWLIVFSVFLGWAIYRFLGGTPKQAIFAAPLIAWCVTLLFLARLIEFLRTRQPSPVDAKPNLVVEGTTGRHDEAR